MTDIPDDIKAQVDIVMLEIPDIWYPGDNERVANAIALVIHAERERAEKEISIYKTVISEMSRIIGDLQMELDREKTP